MHITLIVGLSSEKNAEALREQVAGTREIEVVAGDHSEFGRTARLDAEYLPITAAERWGSFPILDGAQILATSASDQEHGFPTHIIAGGALSHAHRTRAEELSVVLRALLTAVAKYNDSFPTSPIVRVGLGEQWLGFDAIGLDHVGQCLHDAMLWFEHERSRATAQ